MITALGGGSGAAKFLRGLVATVPPEEITVVVNTADDMDIFGLRVSPDIDTIIYRLSGNIDEKKGWGLRDDTFSFLAAARGLGLADWFGLGDADLATQVFRKNLHDRGATLSESTRELARRFSLGGIRILPMTDDRVETWIETDRGEMHFQEYYVKHAMEPEVRGVEIRGAAQAAPAPGVLEAVEEADVVIVCPSNPVISIGPILEVRGVRERLRAAGGFRAAVSPLVGGKPLKGPADRLMRGLGMRPSSAGVAELYADFLDAMAIDRSDAGEAGEIEAMGIKTLVTDTVIPDEESSRRLASKIVALAKSLPEAGRRSP